MNLSDVTVCVDFDGTCVEHCYPGLGAEIGAAPYLKAASDAGVRIILWTLRSKSNASSNRPYAPRIDTISQAVGWFEKHGIKLFGVNKNPMQQWSDSPKCEADYFIDDRNLGADLTWTKFGPAEFQRPYVDWSVTGPKLLKALGLPPL